MTYAPLLAALIAAGPASPAPAATTQPSPHPVAGAALAPEELFSRRAIRRARLLIQMRLFQLRDERLECVREALRRRLPDALWPEEPSPWRGAADASEAAAKCARLP
jgi:hypothetical protein